MQPPVMSTAELAVRKVPRDESMDWLFSSALAF
jgi:hypothetical protein